jgi:hypothetical protein
MQEEPPMKIAHVGKSFVILFALASNGCALEASETGEDDTSNPTEQSTSFVGNAERREGTKCAPVIEKDEAGQLYVKAYLCPLPSKPLPDPESTAFENHDGEWVSGGSTENSVY